MSITWRLVGENMSRMRVRSGRSNSVKVFIGASALSLVATSLAFRTAAAAPAEVNNVVTAADPGAQHCVALYGAAPSAEESSPLIAESCSNVSMNEAMTTFSDANGVDLAAADLLMTWFEDIDFGGDSTDIFGDAGPCDSAGYRIESNGYWKDNMSSIGGTIQCNRVDLNDKSLTYGETQILPTSWVGETLEDNVGLTRTYNR